ncbi:MAG: hypothetical protein Kow0069_27250 [Promethearchaeota archaeon]
MTSPNDKRKKVAVAALVVAGVAAGAAGVAWLAMQEETAPERLEAALKALFASRSVAEVEALLDQSLLDVAPAAGVLRVVSDVARFYGEVAEVHVDPRPVQAGLNVFEYAATLKWSTISGVAGWNDLTGKVNSWTITRMAYDDHYLAGLTLEGVLADFDSLPGNKTLVFARDGEVLASRNPGAKLAVGSTFKLWVLEALVEFVEHDPSTTWNTTLALREDWKSLPSGVLQDVPTGTEFTLRQLAEYMVNVSDNTATDHLVRFLGRERVEALLPAGYDLPFLATAEVFKLRWLLPAQDLAGYLAADEAARRQVLEGPVASVNVSDFYSAQVNYTEDLWNRARLEWHFNATDVLNQLVNVREAPISWTNPGLADPARWERVAYKGGSDVGVLSLAHACQAANGSWYQVYLAVNDYDLDRLSEFGSEALPAQIGAYATCQRLLGFAALQSP